MNEQVRQALEQVWHANRVLLAADKERAAALAAHEAASDLLRERTAACNLAEQELRQASDWVWELARQEAETGDA